MKKIKIVSLIVLIILLLCSARVLAAEPQIAIEGETNAKPGETKTVTVKITSPDIEVGLVSGIIQKSSNITSMTVKGINDWTLTYNQDTGDFNTYNVKGTKSGEIATIEYTVANTEGTAEITMSNVKLTTINYESKDVADISKQITIKDEGGETPPPSTDPKEVTLTSIKVGEKPTKTVYTVGEKFDKTGMVIIAEYSDTTTKEVTNYTYEPQGELGLKDTKITITYQENGITKTVEQKITVSEKTDNKEQNPPVSEKTDNKEQNPPVNKDGTESNQTFPNTGIGTEIIFSIIIGVFAVIVLYRKNVKYKDIK